MVCEACGTENRAGSRFCDRCGSPLSLSCPTCGEPNRADALFCASCGASVRAEPVRTSAEPSAERRQVSVLFADLVGFTAFAEGRDPERVRALQQQYFDAATEAITRHGGMVEKFIGDAVMAVWGTPVAHEDDAQRAVRAGLEIIKAVEALGHELEARAGVVTGEAAVTLGATNQGMVAGDMVNTAARLQAAAQPGQILADHATVQAAQTALGFEAVEDLQLKGKSGPMRAWRATRLHTARSGDLVDPPFVGRVEELRRLKDLLHSAGRDRRIRLVSITGPAGIGKSRLVDELRSYAEGVAELFPWHTGRSPSYGEAITFWALGEMVRRRAGLAEADDEQTTRSAITATLEEFVPSVDERRWMQPALLALLGFGETSETESLFPAWRTFFERIAERGTTVLVFEDLQWADSGTLEFIEHLLDWSRNQPIVVITLARPELLDARPGWGTGRSNATAMALEPMPEADMRALLAGILPGLPDEQAAAIVRRSEGMPLYAVEMVRALLAEGRVVRDGDVYRPTGDLTALPIPASLRSLIASRLDALPPEDRTLLRDASVLGLAFSVEALSAVTSADATDLLPRLLTLVRRELLEVEADPRSPERGQFRFVQSLIREVAYETLAMRDRRTRHLAAARHLEASESDEAAGALASHYLAAYRASDDGPEADAVSAQARISLRAAADRAASLGAYAQAVGNIEHALSITDDPRERAELLERAATYADHAAMPTATDFARQALTAYEELGDREATLRATALLADILMDEARIQEATDVLTQAVEAFSDTDDLGEVEALLLATYSRVNMRLDRNVEAVAAADRALEIAEGRNLDYVAATALVNKGSAYSQSGRRREGVALLEGAIRLAEQGQWSHLELRARLNLSNTLSDDEPTRALELAERAAELARRRGDLGAFSSAVWLLADVTFQCGDAQSWEPMLNLIAEAAAIATPGVDRVNLQWNWTWCSIVRGEDVSDDLALLDRYVAEATDPRAATVPHVARAWLHHAHARRRDADVAARAAIDIDPWASMWVGTVAAAGAALRGDLAGVHHVRERALSVPASGRWSQAQRGRLSAIAAWAEGRADDALRQFGDVASKYREIGVRVDLALMALEALAVAPADARVRDWAGEAREIFADRKMTPYLARLDEAISAGDRVEDTRAPGVRHSGTASPAAAASDEGRNP